MNFWVRRKVQKKVISSKLVLNVFNKQLRDLKGLETE